MKKRAPYSVLLADDAIVAIDKAPGLALVPGRAKVHSLVDLLAADPQCAGQPLLPIYRVDAEASGLVLLARTPEAQKALAQQFRLHTVTKEYWALVRGTPLHESGSIDLPIGIDPHNPSQRAIRGTDPKKARTKWVLAERFAGVTLLKVFPVTDRRHQIRVHLKAMGYPLAVDPLYGTAELKLSEFKRRYKLGKFQEERPLMSRLTLHAKSLTFVHPTTGQETTLSAELPKDFRATLTTLQRWAKEG